MEILIILAILAVAVIYVIGVYNGLSRMGVRIQEAWSQIDVQLKRRVDLIPNLVETVKGYASHEKELFENVTKARSALISARTPEEAGQADQSLMTAVGRLFAVAEAYPELKAQEGFVNLQRELSDTENKIAYSRQFYNSVVRDYNARIVVFPSNIIAGMFGFTQKEFFEAADSEKGPVKVEF